MKKQLFSLLVALGAMFTTACSVDNTADVRPSDGDVTYNLNATISQTRTNLTLDNELEWSYEDAYGVLVADASGNLLQNVKIDVVDGNSQGTVTAPADAVLYGYYPYNEDNDDVATLDEVTFYAPSQIEVDTWVYFKAATHFLACKASVSGTTANFVFKPLVSILNLNIYDDTEGTVAGEEIYNIELRSESAPLAGNFTAEWGDEVTLKGGAGYYVMATTEPEDYFIGSSKFSGDPLFMYVPKGVYDDLTVTVYTENHQYGSDPGFKFKFSNLDCTVDGRTFNLNIGKLSGEVEAAFSFAHGDITSYNDDYWTFNVWINVVPEETTYIWGAVSDEFIEAYGPEDGYSDLEGYAEYLFEQYVDMGLSFLLDYGMIRQGYFDHLEALGGEFEAYEPGHYRLFAFPVDIEKETMGTISCSEYFTVGSVTEPEPAVEAKFTFEIGEVRTNDYGGYEVDFTIDVDPEETLYLWSLTSDYDLEDYGCSTVEEFAERMFEDYVDMGLEAMSSSMFTGRYNCAEANDGAYWPLPDVDHYYLFAFSVDVANEKMGTVQYAEFDVTADAPAVPELPEGVTIGLLPAKFDEATGTWVEGDDNGYEFETEYVDELFLRTNADGENEIVVKVVSTVFWQIDDYPFVAMGDPTIDKESDVQILKLTTTAEDEVYDMSFVEDTKNYQVIRTVKLHMPKIEEPTKSSFFWLNGTPAPHFEYDGKSNGTDYSDDGEETATRESVVKSEYYSVSKKYSSGARFFAVNVDGPESWAFGSEAKWLELSNTIDEEGTSTATWNLTMKAKGNPDATPRYAAVVVVYPEFEMGELYNADNFATASTGFFMAQLGEIFWVSQDGNVNGEVFDDNGDGGDDNGGDNGDGGNDFPFTVTGGNVTIEKVTEGEIFTKIGGASYKEVYQVNVLGKTDKLTLEFEGQVTYLNSQLNLSGFTSLKWLESGSNGITVSDFPASTAAGTVSFNSFYYDGWNNQIGIIINVESWD